MLKETENQETRLFVTFLSLVTVRLGGGAASCPYLPPPGYACESTSILFMIIRFCMLFCLFALDAYRSDTNGSILYDQGKYVVLLIKVKIVLNNSCNLKS